MSFTIGVAVVGLLAVLWYILTYNSLTQAKNAVDQTWSNVEVELKRRFDLIANLIEVAKGYAKYESETLQKVVAARSGNSFSDATQANSAQRDMTQAVSQIMILAESYPQLRADQQFLNLQKELSETENRIAERRQSYNQTVNLYLNSIHSAPANIVAGMQGFTEKPFFDAPDEEINQVPEVKLS